MITQLNPALPMVTPRGKGLAHILIDYGTDHDLVWVVFQQDGQVWCWRNQEIRADSNVTFGRMPDGAADA